MKIHEYQAKELMFRFGIPTPRGHVVATPADAAAVAAEIGSPVAIKAQVLVGGRGKAGGIKLARDSHEAERVAASLLGIIIKGSTVRRVLVTQAIRIEQELYLGATLDRTRKRIVFMASAKGGVDIEALAQEAPHEIVEVAADPFFGLTDFQARRLAFGIGLPPEQVQGFANIAVELHRCFVECDATLAEINPLVITAEGNLLALDAKMILDDSALSRQKDLATLRDLDEEDPYERRAREHGLSYVRLDGTIGCMVNGAGLAMATMDMLALYGGRPANFLDVGGGAGADRVASALRIIVSDPNLKAMLFNIFGGITRCDEVARGIVLALKEMDASVPMVARLSGTNEEAGVSILEEAEVQTAKTLQEATELAVSASQRASR